MQKDKCVCGRTCQQINTKPAHHFSGELWSSLISWSVYNIIMRVSSPPFSTLPIPAVNRGGGTEPPEKSESMERNKHGERGRCVLTVGMFASLGVIKRYPTLPPPQVMMLISKLEGSLNHTQDLSPRATCQTKASPWNAMRMTGGVLSLFNFVDDLWANEKAAHGSEASLGCVMSFWLINLKLSFSPRAIKKHQI